MRGSNRIEGNLASRTIWIRARRLRQLGTWMLEVDTLTPSSLHCCVLGSNH